MSARTKLIKIGLPLLIIIVALGVTKIMIGGRKAPVKTPRVDRGALVETVVATKTDRIIKVNSTGTIQPRREVTIIPQVSGLVTSLSAKLIGGGFFQKGEELFTIETVDYELALERALATLAKREYELSAVESRARIAKLEWDRLKKGQKAPANSLALYGPQLKDAKANRSSASATLRQAEIDLERTTVKAPFNCVIRSESLDLGQYVKSGSGVVVVVGTDTAEVVVPIDLDDLYWLEIPGSGRSSTGSAAQIILSTGSNSFSWPGSIDRALAEVDPLGRMARLVVSIQDPYLIKKPGVAGQPPLAIGSFVDISFTGRTMQEIFALPRQALRDNNTVWIMTDGNLLKVKAVKTARLEEKEVLIRDGIAAGDRVILTNLTGAANGMKLRAVEQGEDS